MTQSVGPRSLVCRVILKTRSSPSRAWLEERKCTCPARWT
jgi:hypothetical protein